MKIVLPPRRRRVRAPFPYHHCVILGCTEMTPPGTVFCAAHCATEFGDAFFPKAPVASQEQLQTSSVSGDAAKKVHHDES